jgi:hypothetical protein
VNASTEIEDMHVDGGPSGAASLPEFSRQSLHGQSFLYLTSANVSYTVNIQTTLFQRGLGAECLKQLDMFWD